MLFQTRTLRNLRLLHMFMLMFFFFFFHSILLPSQDIQMHVVRNSVLELNDQSVNS